MIKSIKIFLIFCIEIKTFLNQQYERVIMEKKRQVYESPKIEVIEFELTEAIATSAGPEGAFAGDEIAGGMW
jgi:hypothetical protein